MNRKIPFHELATLLGNSCNISQAEAEDFIKNFFEIIAKKLVESETVKIKQIGTFAPSSDPTNPVTFIPDAAIADTINAPFAMFEPEAVNESLTEEDFTIAGQVEPDNNLSTDSSISNAVVEETVQEESIVEEPVAEETTVVESAVVEPTIVESAVVEATIEESVAEPVIKEPVAEKPLTAENITVVENRPAAMKSIDEDEPEEYYEESTNKSTLGFGWGFIIGMLVGLAVGACGVYFAIDYLYPPVKLTTEETITEEENLTQLLMATEHDMESSLAPDTMYATAVADTMTQQAVPSTEQVVTNKTESKDNRNTEKPVVKTVKDTVKPGYLLNHMAQKHYGNKCFWVYIYEENKTKIPNPNRVSPGLVLVIPPAEKYGIDASSQSSIKAANTKAGKILAKYPK